MTAIILLAFVAGFAWIFAKARTVRRRTLQQTEAFRERFASAEVFTADAVVDRTVLAVDAGVQSIAVGKVDAWVEVPWQSITKVEVERDGASLTTTNRGSQLAGVAVGNVLLGPMGLLIGGLTASKTTRERINELALKIVIDHPQRPVRKVVFFRNGKGAATSSAVVTSAAETLDHFHALLLNALRSADMLRRPAVSPSATVVATGASVEDRIARLWDLHQSGALSEAEFASQKAAALHVPPSNSGTAGDFWSGARQ